MPEEEGTGYPLFWAVSVGYILQQPRNFFLGLGLSKLSAVIGMWLFTADWIVAAVLPLGIFVPATVAAVMNFEVNRNTYSMGKNQTSHMWLAPAGAAILSLILLIANFIIYVCRERADMKLGAKAKKAAKFVKDKAGQVWEHAICPATGRDYWYNPKTEESTYRDPTKEWKRDATGRLNSYAVPAGGGKNAQASSSLADILLGRRIKAEKRH
jgi:hypothetical protein